MAIADFQDGWHTRRTWTERGLHKRMLDANDILSRPLFLIAATEKSGTTWLQIMLDAPPNVLCRGEGQFAGVLTPAIGQALKDYSEFIAGLNEKVFNETPPFPVFNAEDQAEMVRLAAARLWAKCDVADETVILGEKTPGNVRAIGTLERMFPDSRYIFIVRDCRDVVVSGHAHLRRQHGAAGDEPIENYAKRGATVWAGDVARASEAAKNAPGRTLTLRYEDLHQDPVPPLRQACLFLGVDDGDEIIHACVEAGRFENLSGGRSRGIEDVGSQFRKGIVGDWCNVLPREARAVIAEKAGDALRELGYAQDDTWGDADG